MQESCPIRGGSENRLAPDAADEQIGIPIIEPALEEPIRQISINAGVEGSIVVQKVRDADDKNYGYNARTDAYENLVGAGVIARTRVTRTALRSASSIAGLLLTTEAVVTGKPEPKSGAPSMPGAAAAACTEPPGRKAERIQWMNRTGGEPQALRRFYFA